MLKYLCLDCGEVYDSKYLNLEQINHFCKCPKISCNGSLLEIDDFLISTIRNLQHLGFKTCHCNSGSIHLTEANKLFIVLENTLNGAVLPNFILEELGKVIPENFEYKIVGNTIYIESLDFEKNETESEKMIGIAKNCAILLKWSIETLPEFLRVHDLSWREGEVESEDFDNMVNIESK